MKKNNRKRIALAALAATLMASCCPDFAVKASGVMMGKSGQLEAFESIEVSSSIDVKVVRGESFAYKMSIDSVALDKVSIGVSDGELTIKPADKYFGSDYKCQIELFVPEGWPSKELEVEVGGSSKIDFGTMPINVKVDAEVSGASVLKMVNVEADEVSVEVSGASKAVMSGKVTGRLSVELSGASKADMTGLTAERVVSGSASGASDIVLGEIGSADRLEASGASHITYAGSPAHVDAHTSGASSISKR